MTSKELVLATLRGEPTPRTPVGPLAVHFCARHAGHSLRTYSSQAAALAESVLRYHERFQPDAVWISADTWVSAEAMGARIGAEDENQPFGGGTEPTIRSQADLERIPPPDVQRQGRYPMMLEVTRRLAEQLHGKVCIVACFDQFPFSLAAALMGIQPAMLAAVEDPELLRAVMDRAEEYALAYAMALAEAGADILSGGDSPAGLLGPRLYRSVAQPAEKQLIASLKQRTEKPISLHICGNATPILPPMKDTGADVLELDHAVDLGNACRTLGKDTTLWGNLDPVGLLAQSTPAQVHHTAEQALRIAREAGHSRFILSSGCTLAVETPDENLHAMIRAARTHKPSGR